MEKSNYFERFKTEILYLWDAENEAYIKSTPDKGYFVKYPGGTEQQIEASSDTVTRAIHARDIRIAAEYNAA